MLSPKEELKNGIARWDRIGSVSAVAVVAGLLGEFLLPFLPWHPPRPEHWIPTFIATSISNFLVVGGVFLEWMSHRKESRAANGLALIQDEESVKARQETANAMTSALNARLRAEELASENIDLRTNLEKEKQKTSAILERMAWRRIDPAAKARAALPLSRLRVPTNLKLYLVVLSPDFEAQNFAQRVSHLLGECRISANWLGVRTDLATGWRLTPIGVSILADPRDSESYHTFFSELYNGLFTAGIEVAMPSIAGMDIGSVFIAIGINPALSRELDLSLLELNGTP